VIKYCGYTNNVKGSRNKASHIGKIKPYTTRGRKKLVDNSILLANINTRIIGIIKTKTTSSPIIILN
jgi:hypothetical protein